MDDQKTAEGTATYLSFKRSEWAALRANTPMTLSARDLAMSMHPHPTLTETIMEDAELLHGSATHYYKPPRK